MQQEGVFADTRAARLDEYMANEGDAGPAAQFTWPRWEPDSAGLMLRFDPPLAYLPRRLDARGRTHASARVLLHNPKGKQTDSGKVERNVYLEGYATVTAGNRTYSDCVYLRTETRMHFPWLARIALTEYLWLAPNHGIVRRVQRLRGRILIRYFEDVIEDELIRCELPESQDTGGKSAPRLGETCSAAVIYLQPAQPVPCVTGAVMQFSAEETGAASAR